MYYKIIAELVDLPVDEFFVFKQTITRNNGIHLYKHSFRYNAERYYFKNRSISAWNSLATNVVNAKSPTVFKTQLDNLDLSKFLRSRYDLAC